jgi:hypothetical protein
MKNERNIPDPECEVWEKIIRVKCKEDWRGEEILRKDRYGNYHVTEVVVLLDGKPIQPPKDYPGKLKNWLESKGIACPSHRISHVVKITDLKVHDAVKWCARALARV